MGRQPQRVTCVKDFVSTAEAGLAGLFFASFLSASLLPGGSEAVLAALLPAHPGQAPTARLLATVGNTAGGMVTHDMRRLMPQEIAAEKSALVRRRGAPVKTELLAQRDYRCR